MRVVGKAEAVQLLEEHCRELLGGSRGCVLCALVRQRDATLVVHENTTGIVLLDRFGARRGHLLVAPKRHLESVSAFDWREYSEIQRLGFDACRTLERALSPKRVYTAALGASTALSMSYPHYHLHVVPIYEDDERARPARVFSWSCGVVIYEPAEALELVTALSQAWP